MQHTDAHHDQECRAEPPKIDNGTPCALHEIIGIRTSSAYPVWQRSKDVGRHNEEWQILLPEGAGENDEEEADSEDLRYIWISAIA